VYRNEAGQALPDNAVNLTGITADKKETKFTAKTDGDGFVVQPRLYTGDQGQIMRGEEFGRIVPRKAGTFFLGAVWGALIIVAWCAACGILAFQVGHCVLFGVPLAISWMFIMNMVM
jgi:hypothetical protein